MNKIPVMSLSEPTLLERLERDLWRLGEDISLMIQLSNTDAGRKAMMAYRRPTLDGKIGGGIVQELEDFIGHLTQLRTALMREASREKFPEPYPFPNKAKVQKMVYQEF